jgi:hypothetical protein
MSSYFTPSKTRIRHVEVKAIKMPRTMEIMVSEDESARERMCVKVDEELDDDDDDNWHVVVRKSSGIVGGRGGGARR